MKEANLRIIRSLCLISLTILLLTSCDSSRPAVIPSLPAATKAIPVITIDGCTELECSDVLRFELTELSISGDYTLKVIAQDTRTLEVYCVGHFSRSEGETGHAEPVCSSSGVTLIDFVPKKGTVTITWSDGEISQAIEPEYELYYPNGPDCPPECRTGTIRVHVPGDSQ
jgi:hypothetical protein